MKLNISVLLITVVLPVASMSQSGTRLANWETKAIPGTFVEVSKVPKLSDTDPETKPIKCKPDDQLKGRSRQRLERISVYGRSGYAADKQKDWLVTFKFEGNNTITCEVPLKKTDFDKVGDQKNSIKSVNATRVEQRAFAKIAKEYDMTIEDLSLTSSAEGGESSAAKKTEDTSQ